MNVHQQLLMSYPASGGGGGSDPYWSSVAVSAPLSADFSDIKGHSVALTGSPAISGGKADFSNTTRKRAVWSRAVSGEFVLTGDFTMECYVTPSVVTSFAEYFGSGSSGSFFTVRCTNTGALQLYSGTDRITSTSGALVANTRNHIEIDRASGVWRLFLNGALVGSYSGDTGSFGDDSVHIGAFSFASQAFLDGFRFTQGVARHTSAFTPPSTPYPTS